MLLCAVLTQPNVILTPSPQLPDPHKSCLILLFFSHCIYDVFFSLSSYCTFTSSIHREACALAWQKSHSFLSGPYKSHLWQDLPCFFSSQPQFWTLTSLSSESSSCSKLKANSHEGIIQTSVFTFLTNTPSLPSMLQLQWDHPLWNVWKSCLLPARSLLEALFFPMAALRYVCMVGGTDRKPTFI